jgi:CRISPR-associated protein Cas2
MSTALHVLVIYDLVEDKVRLKVANLCFDYGLDRIQYSAFYGKLTRTHQQEMIRRARRLLGKTEGKIQLIPIGEDDWQKRLELKNDPGGDGASDG